MEEGREIQGGLGKNGERDMAGAGSERGGGEVREMG